MSRVSIQSLPSGLNDAKRLATKLGIAGDEIGFHRFPDGELRVTVGPVAPVTIVYAPLDNPNDKLVGTLIACEALRRNGAEAARSSCAVHVLHAARYCVPPQ